MFSVFDVFHYMHPVLKSCFYQSILFQVVFPSGTFVALGPYLSYIKVFASPSDLGYTEGLCGTLDRDRSNEFLNLEGEKSCNLNLDEDECEDFSKSWM